MIQKLDHFDITKIAHSGQCFRITSPEDNLWSVIAGNRQLRLRTVQQSEDGSSTCDFDCDRKEFDDIWYNYFDLQTDYESFCRLIDPVDPYLNAAAQYGRGIRILRQDLWETLLSFILSQRKGIPSISKCVENLCRMCGPEIAPGVYGFPSYEAVYQLSEEELRECGVGYRDFYIRGTCRKLVEGDIQLDEIDGSDRSDKEVIDELRRFPGVGLKVANCISLFALHRMAAFPRDTWILKVEKKYYEGHFPDEKYGGCAGLMQQYMFFYEKKR